jgi:hypothetical protein
MKEAGNAGPDGIGPPSTGSQSNERASMIALIFSVRAFFEAELLSNVDAREWLEGRHPGPVQWATYPAGRSLPASNAPR